MSRISNPRVSIAAVITLLVLLPAECTPNSYVCYDVNLKPLRNVSGIIVNPLNEPVPNATVEIWRAETKVLAVKTGQGGKFVFEHLDPGHYEIRGDAQGYIPASFRIAVVKPRPWRNESRLSG